VTFHLRAYSPADFDQLYEIDQQCYEPEIAYSRRELRYYMRFPGATCVVAEIEGTIGGFCLAAWQDEMGYIVTMDVLPNNRRIGMASALLRQVEQKLQSSGVKAIWLETATENEPAIAFWQKHGFRQVRVRKRYYPGGRDAYSMIKTVAPHSENST
jgi:ribosomal-protein-alanine N-acetyltransferase